MNLAIENPAIRSPTPTRVYDSDVDRSALARLPSVTINIDFLLDCAARGATITRVRKACVEIWVSVGFIADNHLAELGSPSTAVYSPD